MPVIEVSILEGTFNPAQKEKLVAELTDILLKWEGAPGNPRAKAGTFVYLHEIKKGNLAIAGKLQTQADPIRYRVSVTLPFGGLDAPRKKGLVEEISKTLIEAEGSEWNNLNRLRVLCLIQEVAEGNWGSGGYILGLLDIARLLGVEATDPRYKALEAALK